MAVYKYAAWILVGVPTGIFSVLMYFSPKTVLGSSALDVSLSLSLIGVCLSYYGLIFSLYAALQVQAISSSFFFKSRSPDVLRTLKKISKEISEFGNEPSTQFGSQSFLSKTPVLLRSAKKLNNRQVKSVAKDAEKRFSLLKASMETSKAEGISSGSVENYWEFYQKISELVDEIGEQMKDAKVAV